MTTKRTIGLGILLLLLIVGVGVAQQNIDHLPPNLQYWLPNEVARIEVGMDGRTNEIGLIGYNDDPVKVRFASTEQGGAPTVGALSGNRIRPGDEEHLENLLLSFSVDERWPGDNAGCFEVFARAPDATTPGQTDDQRMKRVADFCHDSVTFHVPVFGLSTGGITNSLISQDGRFRAVMQDDGNLVVYDQTTAPWTPVFSSFATAGFFGVQ